ncbi:MAG TPA: alanine--glyoxylate aminotransferase family protein [Limnochordia bacterium]|nr:alanine--glyoxylate aminotransferase family protein [Limnochordia bacterium]
MFAGDKLLRVPGPTPVPDRVARAAARPMLWHRSPEFVELFRRVEAGLKRLFETESDVLMIAGSGTAAMESAVANLLSPGEEAIVLNGGKFGERWLELVQAFGARPREVKYAYGQGADPEALDAALSQHPSAKVVFATHNESSTAVLNDIEALAKVARAHGALIVVDAVSSLGGTPLPMDAWGIDVVVTGSQKCLMLPPGLSFVGVGPRAWEKAAESKGHRYYFDWKQYRRAAKNAESPYTSAVSLMFALDESLAMLEEEGAEARFDRHRLMRDMVRAGLKELGFTLFVEERWASPTLTAAYGGGVDPDELRKVVRKKTGVTFAGGQGELKGRIFRIGHMGAATPLDMVTTLAAIEIGLAELGADVTFGKGVGRALEVWKSWR